MKGKYRKNERKKKETKKEPRIELEGKVEEELKRKERKRIEGIEGNEKENMIWGNGLKESVLRIFLLLKSK